MGNSHPEPAPHQSSPNPLAMILHLIKTFSLGGSLLGDQRIHPARKVAFITILGVIIAAALGVDAAGEIITQGLNIIPGLGALLGIGELPVDGAIDWVVVAVAAFSLLKLFPAHIVGEHYDRIFRKHKFS
ncbi:MAG: hypothetical protein PVSMB4_04170 [Ktedonobacterales bacterium]